MYGSAGKAGGGGGGRQTRSLRDRKISQRMAVVDDTTRQMATQARLDALENDNDLGESGMYAEDSSDDEFNVEGSDEDGDGPGGKKGKKRKGKAGAIKRKLRSGPGADRRGPKSFTRLLEESHLEELPAPNYLTAAAGPSVVATARKFCSVCGNGSKYTCARCGSRYCCRKCYTTHVETRCLKFTG